MFHQFKNLKIVAAFWPSENHSILSGRHTGILRKKDNLLRGEMGKGVGARSQFIRPQESLVLYTSFSSL
jgi:hypothetical protein